MIRSYIKNLIREYKKNKNLNKIEQVINSIYSRKMKLKLLDIFKEELEKEMRIFNLKFISAFPLSDERKKEIENFLSNKFKDEKIKIQFEIDKKLIGGFKICYNDKILDCSLINFINKIWRSF